MPNDDFKKTTVEECIEALLRLLKDDKQNAGDRVAAAEAIRRFLDMRNCMPA